MGLLGEPQGQDHDEAGEKQEDGGRLHCLLQGFHGEEVCCNTAGNEAVVALVGCEGHTNKVHKVVAGEGKGQGEGTAQDDDAEDVGVLVFDEQLEEDCQDNEGADEDGPGVGVDGIDVFLAHEGGALQALHDQEVEDGGQGDAAENAADLPVHAVEIEGEDEAADVLHDCACHKGHHNGHENAGDDGEGFLVVDVAGDGQKGVALQPDLVGSCSHCATEEFEDDGHCG